MWKHLLSNNYSIGGAMNISANNNFNALNSIITVGGPINGTTYISITGTPKFAGNISSLDIYIYNLKQLLVQQ